MVSWREGFVSWLFFCIYCCCQARCDNTGRSRIMQLAQQVKHQKAVKFRIDGNQGKLAFKSLPSTSYATTTSATVRLAATSSASVKMPKPDTPNANMITLTKQLTVFICKNLSYRLKSCGWLKLQSTTPVSGLLTILVTHPALCSLIAKPSSSSAWVEQGTPMSLPKAWGHILRVLLLKI